MPRPSALDRIFGGQPGAAEKARAAMHKTYGAKGGEHVYQAKIAKAKRKTKPSPFRGR
jgi:hypothetical protein